MNLVYLAVRIFPFWAIPLGVALVPAIIHYKRRKKMRMFFIWGASTAVLFLLSITWVVMRGDLHAEAWVRAWLG